MDAGLEVLHKQMTVEQNLAGVRILKELGLGFAYGFMLFDPSSTFASVRANIGFLRRIVGDGSAAATFCRMLPYGGTPIRDTLLRENRLRGDVTHPDYDFLDPRIELFFHRVNEALNVTGWIHGLRALSPQLKFAWNEVAVLEGLFPRLDGMPEWRADLARLTAASNAEVLETVEAIADAQDLRPAAAPPSARSRSPAAPPGSAPSSSPGATASSPATRRRSWMPFAPARSVPWPGRGSTDEPQGKRLKRRHFGGRNPAGSGWIRLATF